jgi:hypothetical protein
LKKNTISLKLVIILLSYIIVTFAKEGNPKMFIKFSKDNFEFGESCLCEIIFVNTSNEPVNLQENPKKSVDLLMHAVNIATNEDLNYSIGKMEIRNFGKDQFAVAVPIKEPFEIAPRSMYFFKTDLNNELYLSPGTYECSLVNHMVEKSNKVVVSITFTTASVKILARTAVDERVIYARREWAYDWLKKIDPELQLHLTQDSDSDAQKKEKVTFNQQSYQKFLSWWEENSKKEKYQELIRNINR